MSLEELKLTFCQNEELIKELKKTKERLELKLRELAKQITELEEYKQYIKDSDSEEKRLKLISTEKYKESLETISKIKIIKEKISEEETKLTKQEFEEVNEQAQCNHLFYEITDEEKVCIKCNYKSGSKKTNKTENNIKNLRSKFLYINLSSIIQHECVTEFLQNETLEQLLFLTKEILKVNKNMDNRELQEKLEKQISQDNIKYIEGMYESIQNMPQDTKESYEAYKNRVKR